jgi:RNA polymerase sigma-70 factor (ECF subfamily)
VPADRVEAWALVARAQAGDRDAFGQLYERYFDTVYRFVCRRVRSHRQLAEDLTADTFVRALQGIGRVRRTAADPGAWLVAVARNIVADHYKSAAVRRRASDSECVDVPDVTSREPGPAELAELAALRQCLGVAVAALVPGQRRTIEDRFYRGLSVEESAAAARLTVGAVKASQARACRNLADRISPSWGISC